MPFLQPALTRIASGVTATGVVGTDLYLTDANPDPSGNTINGNLTVTGSATFNSALPFNVEIEGGNITVGGTGYVEAAFVNGTTQLQCGDGTSTTIIEGELPTGGFSVAQDPNTNNGVRLNRRFAAAPATNIAYMDAECEDASGVTLSYGGFSHQNDGTAVGLFTRFYGFDESFNLIGRLEFNKGVGPTGAAVLVGGTGTNNNRVTVSDNEISFGSGTSVTPAVTVIGTGGTGQVYDTIYNPPYLTYGTEFVASGGTTKSVPVAALTTTGTVMICPFTTSPMSQGMLTVANTVNGQFDVTNIDPATGIPTMATQNYYFNYFVLPNA